MQVPRSLQAISIDKILGLRPQVWLCIGAGFSREDIKGFLLSQGQGFIGEAVMSLEDLARKILAAAQQASGYLPEVTPERVLGSLTRQEVLRLLLADHQVMRALSGAAGGFTEIKKLKRQAGFFRKLDQAIQAGRMAFAHEQEEQVYLERLESRLGKGAFRAVRNEIRVLASAYEAWLKGSRLWDLPLLYAEATQLLQTQGWPERLFKPERIEFLSHAVTESREQAFCDALGVCRIDPVPSLPEHLPEGRLRSWTWKRWHSWDDAVEGMLDELLAEVSPLADGTRDFSGQVILIADQAPVRRSLNRALAERGIAQADLRDPSRIRWDEGLKWAMLPLEVLAGNFERTRVISWLKSYACAGKVPEVSTQEFSSLVSAIHSRGIRQGLHSYAGGDLACVHERLVMLAAELGGRKTLKDLAEAHLRVLKRAIARDETQNALMMEYDAFFERFWRDYLLDVEKLTQTDRVAPLRFWLERVRARLQETAPPVAPLKAELGLQVYRLSQAPTVLAHQAWLIGLPPDYLSGDSLGDYWFTEKEREILGSEFLVRSAVQVGQERVRALGGWISQASRVQLFDAHYDYDGRERESLSLLVRELCANALGTKAQLDAPQECGAHWRWRPSYGALRPTQPQEVKLLPLPLGPGVPGVASKPQITATMIDRYSRCPFQGLAYHRWKLRDLRDPDSELWPEVRGNILHQAVKYLILARDPDGNIALSCADALDQSWKKISPKGLFKSPRVETYVRSRLLQVLEVFCAKERDYFQRAGAAVLSLDDQPLTLEYPEFRLLGTPDRIDGTEAGLFIMDYKTSSAVPNGTEMLELGYRLQLPFYALAAARHFQKPVVGAQFIELSRLGTRSSGMFFERFNGKEAGQFTQVRSNSKSLLKMEPDHAWSLMEEQLILQAHQLLQGNYSAQPKKKDKECDSCQLQDLCGFRRKSQAPPEVES